MNSRHDAYKPNHITFLLFYVMLFVYTMASDGLLSIRVEFEKSQASIERLLSDSKRTPPSIIRVNKIFEQFRCGKYLNTIATADVVPLYRLEMPIQIVSREHQACYGFSNALHFFRKSILSSSQSDDDPERKIIG